MMWAAAVALGVLGGWAASRCRRRGRRGRLALVVAGVMAGLLVLGLRLDGGGVYAAAAAVCFVLTYLATGAPAIGSTKE